MMRLAVDTGGTFTDLVLEEDNGALRMFKCATTPEDPVEGILNSVALAAENLSLSIDELLKRTDMFIHGTTHAINAVITGNTAKTAFLTTKGHPDILVIREGGRLEPFNFRIPFPKPYVPRALTFEVSERIRGDGKVLEPLDETAVAKIIEDLKKIEVRAVAVCLIWSSVNPVHEKRVGELLSEHLPGVPYTLSHALNPILREYRRASSAAIDASLKPLMSKYLRGLKNRLNNAGFQGRLLMLTSKGGVMDVAELAEAPIHAIGSGPSMAPIAGRRFASLDATKDTAIVADTGGTTYDVSLVRRGIIPMTPESWIGERYRGHIVGFPSVDVKSIGAGGGSIAWVDSGGLLHVGPQSAGAVPGPACYGRGGNKPTVTDAALALGYIDPLYFLGGAMKLQTEPAQDVILKHICKALGLDLMEAASAILTVATENMVAAIEEITIHQGVDPRDAVLIGAGGAAGLNSVAIARRLGCTNVIIPELGAALSAYGALLSDLHADYRVLLSTSTDRFDESGVNAVLEDLRAKCRSFMEGPGAGSIESSVELTVEAHYESQVWEIEIPVEVEQFRGPQDVQKIRRTFDRVHHELFSYHDSGSEIQFICWRAAVSCKLIKVREKNLVNRSVVREDAPVSRPAYFPRFGILETPIVQFGLMQTNLPVDGPAIIESPFTTIVIEPNSRVVRTKNGSLLITAECTL